MRNKRSKRQNTYVCDEWRESYAAFKDWALKSGYEEGQVELLRKDASIGFEPNNCIFAKKYSHSKKHGNTNSKLYYLYQGMIQKCVNPKNHSYTNFGEKGINVYLEWREDFNRFKDWAKENNYKDGLLIDRKDPTDNFTPKNCFFTTKKDHSSTINSPIISKRGIDNPAYKHGLTGTRLHNIWDTMKQRCFNPNRKDYKDYGGRGILIYEGWLEFENFYNWAMNSGYDDNLTIERKNFDGNYEPSNCTWITSQQQARNKRQNHFITINGESKSIVEWSEISGIPPKTLRYRVVNNWDESDLLSPVDRKKKRKKL